MNTSDRAAVRKAAAVEGARAGSPVGSMGATVVYPAGGDPLAALLARLIADPSIDPRVHEWLRRLAAGDAVPPTNLPGTTAAAAKGPSRHTH